MAMEEKFASKGGYLDWCASQLGPKWSSMASVQLRTRDGATLAAHRDILGAVCKEAADLAEAEAEISADGEKGRSLSALSAITQQFSEAAVRAFLGEVYSCSGVIKIPPGEAGLAAWSCLGPEDQREAVHLADMLHASAVLSAWDTMIAEGMGRTLSSELISRLLLADAFQEQLPKSYAACMALACKRTLEGDEGVARHVPDLSPGSCTALLTSLAAANAEEVAAHAASLAAHEERKEQLHQAMRRATGAEQTAADADMRAVWAEQQATDFKRRANEAEHHCRAAVQQACAATHLSSSLAKQAAATQDRATAAAATTSASEGRLWTRCMNLEASNRLLRFWVLALLVAGAALLLPQVYYFVLGRRVAF